MSMTFVHKVALATLSYQNVRTSSTVSDCGLQQACAWLEMLVKNGVLSTCSQVGQQSCEMQRHPQRVLPLQSACVALP